ncbi:MAG TPA: hypothetical protein VFD59_20355 [Nocardioidaceae bacterium]|nr:hypothetical protein [Nocardioidaceae bacterium]
MRRHGDRSVRVVAERDPELAVELGSIRGLGASEDIDDVPQGLHERLDLFGRHLAAGDLLAELPLECLAFPLGVVDPISGDGHGIPGVEQGPIVGGLAVAVGDGGS